MQRIILLILALFIVKQNTITLADEEVQGKAAFPSAPPANRLHHSISDAIGNKVRVALWAEKGRLFWYFEPAPDSLGEFILYPGEITVAQEGKTYQDIDFKKNNGEEFAGPIKEAMVLQFNACDWRERARHCINSEQPFEIYFAPNNFIKVSPHTIPKVNSLEIR